MVSDKRMVRELAEAMLLAQSQSQAQAGANPIVKEALDNVMAMLAREDQGWEIFQGGNGAPVKGMELNELKVWSAKLREFAAANPLGKRGFKLQHAYVEKGGGIKYKGVPGLNGEPPADNRGRAPRVKEKILDPVNQRNFFGKNARRERHLCLYTEGIRLWIGDDKTKKLYPIPLDQITGILTDPDFPGVVWAYRRAWSQRQRDGKYKDFVKWYFVDHAKDMAVETIHWGNEEEKVDTSMTAFDMHANSFDNWPFGIPDALAAWIWADIVKNLYMDGVDVSSAMATLAFKVNAASKAAGQNAAVQFASPQSAGGTAIMGVGTDLSVLSSAGKGYDFSHIRGVIAMVATSLDVSTIALTSNTADAGSSYGSAATLDEPGRLTMMTRRDEDIALDERVLRWMDPNGEFEAYFEPYEDGTEIYRQLQAITLIWLQGVISDEVYKGMAADILGIPSLGDTPQGMLMPNNIKSLARKDIDTDGGPTGSAGAPTQGRSSGNGGDAPRDTRDDTIT